MAPSRTRAQELVKGGLVAVAGVTVTKPAAEFDIDVDITVAGDIHPWVGRGGMKLDHALKEFSVNVAGRTCLDLGASTGGFTDVLLHHGAAKVYAVDVGHGQLHQKLRGDARVISLEGLHAKDLDTTLIPDALSLIVVDVSFISLTKALPPALALAGKNCDLVALVKPQFEVGREGLARGGIVKDEALQKQACVDVQTFIESTGGWDVQGIIRSPVAGGDGNTEYLLAARNY